jgi:hypothetical protein
MSLYLIIDFDIGLEEVKEGMLHKIFIDSELMFQELSHILACVHYIEHASKGEGNDKHKDID